MIAEKEKAESGHLAQLRKEIEESTKQLAKLEAAKTLKENEIKHRKAVDDEKVKMKE